MSALNCNELHPPAVDCCGFDAGQAIVVRAGQRAQAPDPRAGAQVGGGIGARCPAKYINGFEKPEIAGKGRPMTSLIGRIMELSAIVKKNPTGLEQTKKNRRRDCTSLMCEVKEAFHV